MLTNRVLLKFRLERLDTRDLVSMILLVMDYNAGLTKTFTLKDGFQ